jgi:hypothetical protein
MTSQVMEEALLLSNNQRSGKKYTQDQEKPLDTSTAMSTTTGRTEPGSGGVYPCAIIKGEHATSGRFVASPIRPLAEIFNGSETLKYLRSKGLNSTLSLLTQTHELYRGQDCPSGVREHVKNLLIKAKALHSTDEDLSMFMQELIFPGEFQDVKSKLSKTDIFSFPGVELTEATVAVYCCCYRCCYLSLSIYLFNSAVY